MHLFQRVAAFTLVLVPSFFVVACSDDAGDNANGSGGETSDPVTLCEDYFDAYRAIAERCLDGTDFDSDFRASEKDGFVKECRYTLELPGVSATFASKLNACSATIKSASCDEIFTDEDICDFEDERGSIAAGAACEEDVQCASSSCNTSENPCGTCAAEVADGAACDFEAAVCKRGSFCRLAENAQTSDGVCTKEKAAGEACDDSRDECVSGTRCDEGTCKAPPKLGEACTSSCQGFAFCEAGRCVSLPGEGQPCLGQSEICSIGLTCNETTTLCEKDAGPTVEIGGACGNENRCKTGFCSFRVGSDGTEGTCKAFGKVDEACDDTGVSRCESGLRCTAGKCVELTPLCQ